MYVSNPTEDFAKLMVGFRNLSGNNINELVTNAAVLSYSILLHKTYKNKDKTMVSDFLEEQLKYFNTRLQSRF